MSGIILIGLVNNAALLLALGLLYDTLSSKQRAARPDSLQLLTGLILGAISIAVMANPVKWSPGIIFDTRSVMLCVSGLFFGTVPTLLAVVIAGAYRIYLGGDGAMMGVAVTLCSGAIGVGWRHYRRREVQDLSLAELYIFGLVVHAVMILCMFLLPRPMIASTIVRVGIPVMVVYPVGTALLGRLMTGRHARRRAEEALRASEAKYRELYELGSDAYLFIENATGRILEVNSAAIALYGYTREELLCLHNCDLSAEPDETRRFTETPVDPGQVVSIPLRQHRKKDGRTFPVEIACRFFVWQGRPVHIAAIRDITDRQRAEQERLQLERQMQETQKLESLGVLAGGIAHDFNNLLLTILGNSDLALLELPGESPARPHLQEIEHAAHRAADLCRQMLAYSGKGQFVIEVIHIRDLVLEISHLLRASISKRAQLQLEVDAPLPPVSADATQIRQVIMNLVLNASEALGDQDGTIRITTGAMDCSAEQLRGAHPTDELPPGPYVWFEVADSGCGMDAETQKRIFEPFFTTKFAGRGLGLSAVMGIVRGHRGVLRLASAPGQGTTFRVMLPAVTGATAPERLSRPPDRDWRGSGTILLADDEPTVLRTGQRLLERLGFQVLTAQDGQEVITVFGLHRDRISAVLLDLTMPRLDGLETYRALRELDPKVRVILSSGYTESDVLSRFAGSGLAGFAHKPYTLDQMRSCLQTALEPPQP